MISWTTPAGRTTRTWIVVVPVRLPSLTTTSMDSSASAEYVRRSPWPRMRAFGLFVDTSTRSDTVVSGSSRYDTSERYVVVTFRRTSGTARKAGGRSTWRTVIRKIGRAHV